MDRNFIGYGNHLPKVEFPHGARIAVNFVLNYEEGSERNILDGDNESESYLTDIPGIIPLRGERHSSSESMFEYGSRAGIWRLLHLFEDYGLPLTLFATGQALERNPELGEKLKHSPHEIAGHGYRWINYRNVDIETERDHIKKTIRVIQNLTQKTVTGWYTGRRSENTLRLISESGLRYDSDSYADDLPYWIRIQDRSLLIIPYSLDTNDLRYATTPGWGSQEDFVKYLKGAFDFLYREGVKDPKMMSIGMHPRLSGRPGRAEALREFIEYIKKYDKVWICRREEIADYWYKNHPI